jgi:hypothetical protein
MGTAQGISRVIAQRLTTDGFNVVVNNLAANSGMLEEFKKEIGNVSGNGKVGCEIVCGNVSEEGDVKRLVAMAVKRSGSVDIVSSIIPSHCSPSCILVLSFPHVHTLLSLHRSQRLITSLECLLT